MIEIISRKSDSCKFCKESKRSKIKNVKIIYEYEDPEAYGYPEPAYWSEEIDTFFCPMCGRVINGSRIAEALKDPDVERILSERGALQSDEKYLCPTVPEGYKAKHLREGFVEWRKIR